MHNSGVSLDKKMVIFSTLEESAGRDLLCALTRGHFVNSVI